MNGTVIILLAAGEASRMGRPKQLLEFHSQTFIERMIHQSAQIAGHQIVLVLGANQQLIKEKINTDHLVVEVNSNWETGMGSSIKAGLKAAIKAFPHCSNLIFSVIDQPFVCSELFSELLRAKLASKKKIVACRYAGTVGVPVLFDIQYFDLLLNLKDNQGAKNILISQSHDLETITFEKGAIDIDTPEDYSNLIA